MLLTSDQPFITWSRRSIQISSSQFSLFWDWWAATSLGIRVGIKSQLSSIQHFNRPKKNFNSTQIIQGLIRQQSSALKPSLSHCQSSGNYLSHLWATASHLVIIIKAIPEDKWRFWQQNQLQSCWGCTWSSALQHILLSSLLWLLPAATGLLRGTY